ncbi:MAG: hypothetical protein GX800_10170 [Clostridiaceae bacterium]|nr:hypothetical protein [Clostridiaceae bacterium]
MPKKGNVEIVRKQRKTYAQIFDAILISDVPKNEDIGKIAAYVMANFPVESIDEATAFAVAVAAMNGDIKAFEIIREITGQKAENKKPMGKVIIKDDIT